MINWPKYVGGTQSPAVFLYYAPNVHHHLHGLFEVPFLSENPQRTQIFPSASIIAKRPAFQECQILYFGL